MKLNFQPITLKHKDVYRTFPIIGPNSKFSFAQSFMWQEEYQTKISVHDDFLLFTACPENEEFFVAPILKSREAIVPAINLMLEQGNDFCMHYVCPEIKGAIEQHFPDKFEFTLNRDDSEYVYTTESLATLAGKKLHQKRNHINAFCQKYDYQFVKYTPLYFDACMELQHRWMTQKYNGNIAETKAIEKVLRNHDELEISAGVILQDGKVTAFSIGERIGNDAVILIEKASDEFNGLFQVINRDTVRQLFPDTEYINRCEDLGIEGLRKAKLSYRPCFLIDKYTCRLK